MIPAGGRTLTRVENHHGDIDLATADIVDVMEDKDQNVWVACYSRGLMQMSKGREPFQYWSFAEQNYRTGGSVTMVTSGARCATMACSASIVRGVSRCTLTPR